MILARTIREITVKGRNQPVMTYELLGMQGEEPIELSDSVKEASVKPTSPDLVPE